MNPPVDDIFNLFPALFCLSPTTLDYRLCTDSLPGSMLEGFDSNADIPFLHPLPTFIPPTPTPSFNELMLYDNEQKNLFSPTSSLSSPSDSHFSTCQNPPSVKRNTRIGFCEHPKHVFYRQSHSTIVPDNKIIHNQSKHRIKYHERHCQKHSCKKLCRHHHFLHHFNQQKEAPINDDAPMATTPRRGRPPKGIKSPNDLILSMEHHVNIYGSHHIDNGNSNSNINYHIAMTTRPLPKRLEPVIGKSNIYVCLTCLKRSDMDVDYLMDPTYVGPQSSKKKKRNHDPPNLA